VRRGDGQVLQLTPLLYQLLEAVDGARDLAQLAARVSEVSGRQLLADDVELLVEQKLRPLGLVLRRDGTHPTVKRSNPLLALKPRFVVSRPEMTRKVTAPFVPLFNPVLVAVATLGFAAVASWVLFVKGLASAAYDALMSPGLLLAVFAITVVSAGFHEFGHAAALRRGGGTPGRWVPASTSSTRPSTPTSPTATDSAGGRGCAPTWAGSTSTRWSRWACSASGRSPAGTACCS
jgi:putative peptide zinc metalloprotease protein